MFFRKTPFRDCLHRGSTARRTRRDDRAAGRALPAMTDSLERRTMLTTYVVDVLTDDVGDGDDSIDGRLSLREAVNAATTNAAFGDAAAGDAGSLDRIVFADGLSGTIDLADELLVGGGSVSLDGGDEIRLDGNGANRLLRVMQADAGARTTILDFQLFAGSADGNGGAVLKEGQGTLSLRSNLIAFNRADDGGAVWAANGLTIDRGNFYQQNTARGDGDAVAGSGGAIFLATGQLSSSGSFFLRNAATRAGGGIEIDEGDASIRGATFNQNTASDRMGTGAPGNGGAIHVTGMSSRIAIGGSSFTGNTAQSEGGAVWNQAGSTMRLASVQIAGNAALGTGADNGGGGVFNNGGTLVIDGSTLDGNTATEGAGSGGGLLSTGGLVVLEGVTLTNNVANRAGGGIEIIDGDLRLRSVTLGTQSDGNRTVGADGFPAPGNGGGLHVSGTARTIMTGGWVAGNFAASEGGGLWNQAGSRLVVRGTTIERNEAAGDAADNGGGGIFNNGGITSVAGATIRFNRASGLSGSGGGILSTDGAVAITDTGIGFNDANRAGGGIEIIDGRLDITDSSVSFNDVGTFPMGGPATGSPGNGGALHITGVASVRLDNANVEGNRAANEGGGLWNQTGSTMQILNGTTVVDNFSAGVGGGLFNNGGTTTVSNSRIDGNTASGDGGGIFVRTGLVDLVMAELTNNTAGDGGDGDGGGAFVAADGELTLDDDTVVADNTPDDIFRESDDV